MSTSGMLRSDNAIFYHPLDNLIEHTQLQTWSGTCGFVSGKIGDATSAITGDSLQYGAVNTHVTGPIYTNHAMEAISASSVLLAYRGTSTVNVRVGSVSGTTITWGTPESGATQPAQFMRIGLVMLDSTRFVLAHRLNAPSVSGMVRTGTVSGTDVTLGPVHVFACNDHPWDCRLAKIDSNRALLAYGEYNGGSIEVGSGALRVITVSGTDITFGSSVTFDTNVQSESISVTEIDSTRTLISWAQWASPSYNGYAAVVTISGTNATVASGEKFDGVLRTLGGSNVNTGPCITVVKKLTSDKYILGWNSLADGWSARSNVLTVSGTDITVGPESRIASSTVGLDLDVLSASTFVVGVRLYEGGTYPNAYLVGTVSDVNITYGGWSTPYSPTVPVDSPMNYGLAGLDSQTMVGVATRNSSWDSDTAVGMLGSSASISGTSAPYPSVSGATRFTVAMWAKNLTRDSTIARVERGLKFKYEDEDDLQLTISGSSSGFVVWTVSGLGTILNDNSDHLLVVDVEHDISGIWKLRTSIDGDSFVDRGNGSGTVSIPTVDTVPRLVLESGAGNQWVDELTMWAGDKAVFTILNDKELLNLYDLAEILDRGMDAYDQGFLKRLFLKVPEPHAASGNFFIHGPELIASVSGEGNMFIHGPELISISGDLFIIGISGIPLRIIHRLTKTGDYNPQLISTFDDPAVSVNIEIWDVVDGQNTKVTIANSGCYAIGNTGKWGWSTANLPFTDEHKKYQYYFRMISNASEEQYGEFFITVPERGRWSYPD